MKRAMPVVLALLSWPTTAQEPPAYLALPPTPIVEQALAAYPPVKAARDQVRAERANARRLDAGPYEFAVRGDYINHSMELGRFPEWAVGLERTIRLPNKGRADRALGDQNVEVARRMAYRAWCDGARNLLRLWFAWARENVQLQLQRRQVEYLRDQERIVEKRAKAGDAPRVEINLAQAAVAQAEAVVALLEGREAGARSALEQTFPALPVPPRTLPAEPVRMTESLEFFAERVRLHNDEVRVARAGTRRGRLLAERAAIERQPDPALGVTFGIDRSQMDRITRVYLSVPIPGRARAALSDEVRAQADAALNGEAAVVQRVTAEVAMMYGQAQGAYAAWERAHTAAEGMRRNAQSMSRSWQLKEASLSDVIIARRLEIEAGIAAALAQLEAEETRYRLLIEAHLMWNDPEEEAEPHDD
jgi:outer membrane protein TolC